MLTRPVARVAELIGLSVEPSRSGAVKRQPNGFGGAVLAVAFEIGVGVGVGVFFGFVV